MWAAIWSVLVLLRCLFVLDSYSPFAFGTLALDIGLTLAGAIVLCCLASRAYQARTVFHAAPGVCVLALGWLAHFSDVPGRAGAYLKFMRLRTTYAEIVRDVQAGHIGECGVHDGIRYNVDPDLPLRVAFIWDGFLDNWIAVVYDPTGLVLRANELLPDGSNWDEPDLRVVKRLFGGDLIGARRLDGAWYLCGFT